MSQDKLHLHRSDIKNKNIFLLNDDKDFIQTPTFESNHDDQSENIKNDIISLENRLTINVSDLRNELDSLRDSIHLINQQIDKLAATQELLQTDYEQRQRIRNKFQVGWWKLIFYRLVSFIAKIIALIVNHRYIIAFLVVVLLIWKHVFHFQKIDRNLVLMHLNKQET